MRVRGTLVSKVMAFNGHKVDAERCRSAVYSVVGRNRLQTPGYWRVWAVLLIVVPAVVRVAMQAFTNANSVLATAYMAMSWALVAFCCVVFSLLVLLWRAVATNTRLKLIEQMLVKPCLTIRLRMVGVSDASVPTPDSVIVAEAKGAATIVLPLPAALDLLDDGFRSRRPVGGGAVEFVCDDPALVPLRDRLNAVYSTPERVWLDTMADYTRPTLGD